MGSLMIMIFIDNTAIRHASSSNKECTGKPKARARSSERWTQNQSLPKVYWIARKICPPATYNKLHITMTPEALFSRSAMRGEILCQAVLPKWRPNAKK